MAKKSALILASTALAGVFACSFPTASSVGGFEALTAKKEIVNQTNGYDFFSGCIVENTIDIPLDEYTTYSHKVKNLFNNWFPIRTVNYTNKVNFLILDTDYTAITTEISSYSDSPDVPFDVWVRSFYVYNTYEDLYSTSSRVYSDSPFYVPLPFLRQFILGFYLSAFDLDSFTFQGSMSVYNFDTHIWDTRELFLRPDESMVNPSSFDNIFNNPRYIYTYDEDSNYDPLYYDKWVFVSFNLKWETDGTKDNCLFYTNKQYNDDLLYLIDTSNYGPAMAHDDVMSLWRRAYGDTIYLEPINPPDIIFGTVEGFLATEFIPDFSFGDLLLIVLGVMVFGAFLKVFLGG